MVRVYLQRALLLYFVKEVNPYTHLKILLARNTDIINIVLLYTAECQYFDKLTLRLFLTIR